VTTPADAKTPRARCYHGIRHLFTGALAVHIRTNPDLMQDETRLKAAGDALVKLMLGVYEKLDEFVLEDPT
jgi:hypothetical protein